ncbi:MAG: hypothetical protein U5J83_13190 [Bryobacterales bacterium]|nr:hypothetical protein [Bryobacterales bacterium]
MSFAFGSTRQAARVLPLCAAMACALCAHDLQTKVEVRPPFVVVSATYDGAEAASFVGITVHAPATAGIKADAFQTGRTDDKGHFVFLPSAPGAWRVLVDDEMGHRVELVATVANAATPAPAASGSNAEGRSVFERLVVGLSILFGAAGFLYGWLARRRRSA